MAACMTRMAALIGSWGNRAIGWSGILRASDQVLQAHMTGPVGLQHAVSSDAILLACGYFFFLLL